MLSSAILRPSPRTAHLCVKQKTRRYRGLPTSASFSSSSSRSTLKGSHWKASENRYERPTILQEGGCAKARSWDLLKGPADALTLVRAVEQKYGPVESFVLHKDFDNPNLYQTYVRINFRDSESVSRVPEGTETIHVRAPRLQSRQPGGIGLDEILPLISGDPEFLTPEQVSEMSPEDRSIDFRINRSGFANPKFSPFQRIVPPKAALTGYELLNWGGFHDMKPIDSTTPITNKDITDETMEHVHMRAALRDWARYLTVPNPYEKYPDKPIQGEGQESEPLSSLVEMDGKAEEPLSVSEDWVSDVSKPGTVRDPFEDILNMEDISSTRTKTEPVGATNEATEVSQSISTPSSTIDSTSLSNELEPRRESSPTTTSDAQATSPTTTLDVQATSQPDSPPSTAEVEAQEQEPKPPNREANESVKAQLAEARRLREMAMSTGKPKEKQNAKTRAKNKGKKQNAVKKSDKKKGEAKQDVPQPALGGFFSKIRNLFSKP